MFGFLKRLLGMGGPPPLPRGRPAVQDLRPLNRMPGQAAPPVPQRVARPEPKTLSQLDTALFKGLSESDTKQQAKAAGASLLRTMFTFGLRTVIPPVSDPRTLMVDRAMVGEGLITPEELAKIHEVGEKMDAIRPRANWATVQGQAAVTMDKAEREARRQAKKDEAAERDRRRAEAIALRRSTDIIFLGRGVSGGLADRRSHVEKLQEQKLPVLSTPADVAAAMKLPLPRLRWLAFHSETAVVSHYVRFQIPKKSGGTRELAAPHRDLAAAQEWILANILSHLPLPEAAHGFVPGHSTLTNARPHLGQAVVINADLKDFFPSITFPRVKGIFQSLGYSPAGATVLALICTECPRRTVSYNHQVLHVATGPRALPQGACTSPALSNLCARKLDLRLMGLAGKHQWTYTRYADDLTFSAKGEPAAHVGLILGRMRAIVKDEHFEVNEKKTRVQRRNARQSVTGIVVNDRPNVPRKTRRRLRAILHQAKQGGLAAQNRTEHPDFSGWVQGMIGYVFMVNPQQGSQLMTRWREL